MHIQIDSRNPNSIQSYNDTDIVINDVSYTNSLIISANEMIYPWEADTVATLTKEQLQPIVDLEPELIIIGHDRIQEQPSPLIQEWLFQQRIGFECMHFGAACRTFNLLLSEGRSCVAGFLRRRR